MLLAPFLWIFCEFDEKVLDNLSLVVLNKYSTSCTGTITGAPAVSKAQSKFLQLRLAAR